MSIPIPMTWDGEHMTPPARYGRLADRQFVVGQVYMLVEHEERSSAAHRFYFACLNEAFASLPAHLHDQFPNVEKLRKYALIKAGYCDSRTFVCSSRAEAYRIVSFMRPVDEFAIFTVEGATVTHYTAKSQQMKAMGKEEFRASKDAVLRIVSDMIGVDATELLDAGRAAA